MTRQGLESHTFGLDRSRYNPFTRYAVQNTFDTHKYLYLFFKFPVLSPGLSSNQHTNSVPTKSSFFHNFGIDKSFFLNPSGFYTTLAICTAILYDYTTVGDAVIDGSLFSFQVSFFFFFSLFQIKFCGDNNTPFTGGYLSERYYKVRPKKPRSSQFQRGNFYLKDWLRFGSMRLKLINFQTCVLLFTAARFYTSIELVDPARA